MSAPEPGEQREEREKSEQRRQRQRSEQRAGPLAGIRVLELAGIGPGPFCAMMLADSGATVLRIDRPAPNGSPGPSPAHPERELLNRGRQSAMLDLKHPRAVDALLRLIDQADVLLEGFRPGVTERLGLGPDVCLQRNPRLVYARMTGWGQDGPLSATVGHDIGYIARTGALHALGRAGGPPQFPANLLGDFGGGGMLMAYGICAALVERAASGQGQVIDAAIVDGVASLLAMPLMFLALGSWRDERGTNLLDGGVPWYDVYQTADGEWMAVGALEPRFYAALLNGLGFGKQGLADVPDRGDPRNWPELRARLTARFAERTRDEWTATFAGSEACVEPVLSMTEAAADPHLTARQTYLTGDGLIQPAPSPRFSRTPGRLSQPPPRPGQHTIEALTEWGLADVQDLIADGAAVQSYEAERA
jgi:alpha-methylacyl-CoA racemase